MDSSIIIIFITLKFWPFIILLTSFKSSCTFTGNGLKSCNQVYIMYIEKKMYMYVLVFAYTYLPVNSLQIHEL